MSATDGPRFDAGLYHDVASGYLAMGLTCRCADVCRAGVAEYPDNGSLWRLLGEALAAEADWAGTIEAMQAAGRLIPLGPAARLTLAEALLGLYRPSEARAEVRYLDEDGHCPPHLRPRLAHALTRAGLYGRAKRLWNALRRETPDWAEAHYRYALALHDVGAEPERLFEPLHEAAMLAPEEPRYRLRLAEAWAALGCHADAVAELDELKPELIDCADCLRRGADLFAAARDRERADRWRTIAAGVEGRETSQS